MTDATQGSVAEQAGGQPGSQTQAAANGSDAAGAKSWLDGLSEGNRKLAETKGWTAPESADKVLSSYAELEGKVGQSLQVPKPDAAPEEWDKFFSRAGRPESPDNYEFKRPENLPTDAFYSDDLAKAAKPWMHEAGLNPKQAQTVHDKFVVYMAEQQAAVQQRQAAAVEKTHDTLVKEWGGPPDSEPFKKNLALADRAMKNLGLVESYKANGILLADGSLTDPQIAKAFAAIGEKMFREDTIGDRGGGEIGENPFKRDAKGSIKSVTAVSALIKSDPERAKRLAREAGEDIRNWMPTNPF